MMASKQVGILATIFLATVSVKAGTQLDHWHSYTHQPSGLNHYSFNLASYKRGLFFGSCGPSTKSLQWAFQIDLTSSVSTFEKGQISLTTDSAAKLKVISGQITIDVRQEKASITLVVEEAGTQKPFVGNGKYRIHKLR